VIKSDLQMMHAQSSTDIVNEINNSKWVHKFNKYISDIRIEVEILKVRTSQRNNEEVQERISKIDRAISGITNMLLEYAEKSGKREVILL